MEAISFSRHGLDTLTRREREVLDLLGQWCTNKQISESLYVSLGTVKIHVRNVRKKLRVGSRYDAARIALKHKEHQVNDLALPAGWKELTRREQIVALALADPTFASLTEELIAQRLGIRATTLKKHLQRIYRKLNVRTRAGATLVAAHVARTLPSAHASPGASHEAP